MQEKPTVGAYYRHDLDYLIGFISPVVDSVFADAPEGRKRLTVQDSATNPDLVVFTADAIGQVGVEDRFRSKGVSVSYMDIVCGGGPRFAEKIKDALIAKPWAVVSPQDMDIHSAEAEVSP
jgi:hypothetical protein